MNYNYDEEKLTFPFISWIFFTFLGVFNWVLFYYIGQDIKSKKFIYLGWFYFIINIIFILSISFGLITLGSIILSIYILGYFGGIIYSFIAIPYYKKRIGLLGKLTAVDLLSTNIYKLNNLELEVLVDNKNYTYKNNNTQKNAALSSINDNSNSSFIILWNFLSYFGIFNCILFYYAGIESKDRKYTNIGHFFLGLGILWIPCFLLSKVNAFSVFMLLISIMGQLFGIVYSYIVRISYRKRINLLKNLTASDLLNNDIKKLNNLELEVLINTKNLNINKSEQYSSLDKNKSDGINNNNSKKFADINYQDQHLQNKDINKTSDNIFEKINVNSATEEELLTLTEITPELAKKIISIRETINGFKSMDEFELLTSIKPHISIKLSDKIIFNTTQSSDTSSNNKKERILDI